MSALHPNIQRYLKNKDALRRVQEDPMDVVAWDLLIQELLDMPLNYTRSMWTTFLEHFPVAPIPVESYLASELKAANVTTVKKYFDPTRRGLAQMCPYTSVWMVYLTAVENSTTKPNEIHEALEYMKSVIGCSIDSGPFWQKYIEFIQNNTLPGEMERAVRSVYHEALHVPFDGVERLLEQYEAWEKTARDHAVGAVIPQELKDTVKRSTFVSENLKAKYYDSVSSGHLSRPPGKGDTSRDLDQYHNWRKMIAYELSNPLGYKDNDQRWTNRVVFAFKRSIVHCMHHVELWIELAMFLIRKRRTEEALEILEMGLKALPQNILLHAAYADILCSETGDKKEVSLARGHEVFRTLISQLNGDKEKTSLSYALYIRWVKSASPRNGVEEARTLYNAALEKDPTYKPFLLPVMAEIEQFVALEPLRARAMYEALSLEEKQSLVSPCTEMFIQHRQYDAALELLESLTPTPYIDNQKIRIKIERDMISTCDTPEGHTWMLGVESMWPSKHIPRGWIMGNGTTAVDPSKYVSVLDPNISYMDRDIPAHMAAGMKRSHLSGVVTPMKFPTLKPSAHFRPTKNECFEAPQTESEEQNNYRSRRGGPMIEEETQGPSRVRRTAVFDAFHKPKAKTAASKRGRAGEEDDLIATTPMVVRRVLQVLPPAVGCVGYMEPLRTTVPSVPFLMNVLVSTPFLKEIEK